MAKMQILKLTKELKEKGISVSNKDVVEYLNANGADVANHMSSIDDKYIDMVRSKFGGDAAKKSDAAAKPAAEKQAEKAAGSAEGGDNKPKKKKHIIFATNNTGRGNRNNNGGRQIVKISNGKIEQPKARKPFQHTEVASPDAFVGVKKENVSEEKPAAAPAPEKTEAPAPTVEKAAPAAVNAAPEKTEEKPQTEAAKDNTTAEQSSPIKRVIGNVYANMAAMKKTTGNGNGNGSNNRSGNGQGRGGNGNRPNNNNGQRRSFGQNNNQGGGQRGSFAQNGNRNFGNNNNRPGFNRSASRPGSFNQNQNSRGGFAGGAAPAPAAGSGRGGAQGHRYDADRRRQSEARRRKEAVAEASMEERARKKFNPHGFHKPAPVEKPVEEEIKVITIPDTLTIRELADHMKIQSAQIIKKLFLAGQVVTLNSELSYDEAENIAADYDILCEHEKKVDVIAELLKEDEEDESVMSKRPPVVCVMGHVDHGKTSLLDKIRQTNVTDKESGGITQAIGAYMVKIKDRKITFLDTPGHEAFTAMRMRGANSTDIAVLVVAADDGVMPQTVEAINHAKAAGVDIIVAVNKIDKPSANIDRVKQELAEYELIPEDWGGTTVFVPVSAKSGEGIDTLLEMILLSADMLELKANANRKARGLVIEAQLDKGRGPVASVLVQKGTLHVGDFIAVGACHGRVRAMTDENGKRIKEAGPSTPAEILGLDDVPEAGEIFISPNTDKEGKEFAETFKEQHKKELLRETKQRMSLDDLYSQIKEGDLKEFNVIIKADVQGSVEALKQSLMKLSNDEVALKVIHGGVGAINESDVILASASNAVIIGFNVRPDALAKQTAETEEVDIHLYSVIYQAIDAVESAMKGLLAPVFEEKILGHVEIRQIFKASQIGNIAGSYVTDGTVERGCSIRIKRDGELIHEGKLASLKRFKDDVKEVREGYECGLVFEDFNDVKELDVVECYKMVEVARD